MVKYTYALHSIIIMTKNAPTTNSDWKSPGTALIIKTSLSSQVSWLLKMLNTVLLIIDFAKCLMISYDVASLF